MLEWESQPQVLAISGWFLPSFLFSFFPPSLSFSLSLPPSLHLSFLLSKAFWFSFRQKIMGWQSFILKCGLWGIGRGLTSIWQFCFQNYNKFSCLTFPSHISSYLLTPWCSILNFEPPPCIYSGLQVLQLFCQPTSTTIHFPVIYCILLCYRPCPVDVSDVISSVLWMYYFSELYTLITMESWEGEKTNACVPNISICTIKTMVFIKMIHCNYKNFTQWKK